MALMSLIGGLVSGAGKIGQQRGVEVDPNAFKIPDADKYRTQAGEQFDAAKERTAYVQPKQRSFIESLEQQAAGQGPSLAGEQLKAASNRTLAQQLAAAQASRNPNAALTQRGLMRSQAETGGQLAEQSAIARMQEQQRAQQMLGGQLSQESAAADQLTSGYLQQGFSMAQAQQQAAADLQRLRVQQALGLAGVNAGIDQQNVADKMKVFENASKETSSLIGGLTGFLSDETQKTEIKDASKDVSKFLDHLSAKTYKYKDSSLPGAAEGKRFGIIAQDFEKSEMGKSVVKQTENGKMIDGAQSLGLIFAAQAELNKRLKNLESKKD